MSFNRLIAFFSLLASPLAMANDTVPPKVLLKKSVTIAAVGDIIPHGAVKKTARLNDKRNEQRKSINNRGFDEFFKPVKTRLSAADVAFANMESPIAPKSEILVKSMVFNSPVSMLYALKNAGVDILSFANNHVYDQGQKGFAESRKNMTQAGFTTLGVGDTCKEAEKPIILTHNGIKIAWMAGTALHNSRFRPKKGCTFFVRNGTELAKAAKSARANGADYVIASVHWGPEYKTKPSKKMKRIAMNAVEGGVDFIIGHHPHVLQPIVKHQAKDGRTTHIAYSLGNFLSNQAWHYQLGRKPISKGNTRDGGLIEFKITKETYADGRQATVLKSLQLEPIWVVFKPWQSKKELARPKTLKQKIKKLKRASKATSNTEKQEKINAEILQLEENLIKAKNKIHLRMQPRILREEIARVKAELKKSTTKRQTLKLKTRMKQLKQRFAHVSKIVGDKWVQPLAPTAD